MLSQEKINFDILDQLFHTHTSTKEKRVDYGGCYSASRKNSQSCEVLPAFYAIVKSLLKKSFRRKL